MLGSIEHLLPEKAKPFLHWETVRPVQFKLVRNRKTKWGYFKAGVDGKPHTISVNSDLNPYAFLFTLVHEMAHVLCWEKFGRSVSPHGNEWKQIFQSELFGLFKQDVFPPDLVKPIWGTIAKPKASCNANPELIKAFSIYDEQSDFVFIDSIQANSQFETRNGRRFRKGEKLRKRFKCQEISTGKWYIFSPVAQVKLI